MTTHESAAVKASKRIEAEPAQIFAVLSQPRRHVEFDGSGMLRGAITDEPISAVGDVFAMKMHHEEFGDYEMNNRVVDFEDNRRITWEPERRDIVADSWHYRWGYELAPDGAGATVVTEFFDLSRSPEEAREATDDGTVWTEAIAASLDKLDELVVGEAAGPGSPQIA
ncbi:MAG TPA: SRPBCC family protein [Acidimicrobiales bacterium]|jgi:hypothetical protein|nr:SRPBCC family protein [Acidimicrobiales bacterium]